MVKNSITFEEFTSNFKKDIDFDKVGMILFHNGVMRGRNIQYQQVKELIVSCNNDKVDEILKDISMFKGIFKVDAAIFEGNFYKGEDLMFVGVAGDVRENVFYALTSAVNMIKSSALKKIEILD